MRPVFAVLAIAFGTALVADTADIASAPVQAEVALNCTFTTECFDLEGCSDTNFAVSLMGRAGGVTTDDMIVAAELTTDAETYAMIGTHAGEVYSLTGPSDYGHGMLTVSGADARFTVHYTDGPLSISYGGVCE